MNTSLGARSYDFSSGLLYPAALGAGIAWLVQAVATRQEGGEELPSKWALLFAVWFLVYHSMWFVHLVGSAPRIKANYPLRHFVSDVLDTLALLVAFWALGFASGHYSKLNERGAFFAAVLVAVSALVGNMHVKKWYTSTLTVAAAVGPIFGIVVNPPHPISACPRMNDFLLLYLWAFLVLYIGVPKYFGARLRTPET
jgi:hypothetical protein